MAKALLATLGTIDPRTYEQLRQENRRLRRRVVDLEAVATRLAAENDALAEVSLAQREEILEPA